MPAAANLAGAACPHPVPRPGVPPQPLPNQRPDWRILTGHYREGAGYAVLRVQGVPEHILLFTLAGAGFAAAGGAWVPCPKGAAVLLTPGHAHYYATAAHAGRWNFLWAHFFPPPHWEPWLAWTQIAAGLRHSTVRAGAVFERARAALARMHARRFAHSGLREPLAMNALEEALLWLHENRARKSPPDPRIQRAADAVTADPARRFDVPELARVAGLSVSRFAHLFREQTGASPQAFVERHKLEIAAAWITAGGRTVSEIAAGLGFESPFYFSRRFRRHFGVCPTRYRAAA